jgi:hypothetical protein
VADEEATKRLVEDTRVFSALAWVVAAKSGSPPESAAYLFGFYNGLLLAAKAQDTAAPAFEFLLRRAVISGPQREVLMAAEQGWIKSWTEAVEVPDAT